MLFRFPDERNRKHFQPDINLIRRSGLPSCQRWDLMVLAICKTVIHSLKRANEESFA
jgi:hypothetical protein